MSIINLRVVAPHKCIEFACNNNCGKEVFFFPNTSKFLQLHIEYKISKKTKAALSSSLTYRKWLSHPKKDASSPIPTLIARGDVNQIRLISSHVKRACVTESICVAFTFGSVTIRLRLSFFFLLTCNA